MPASDRIIIIGGGIIGLLTARALRERGRSVVVLDAGDGQGSASSGNAGIIAQSRPPRAPPRWSRRCSQVHYKSNRIA